MARAFLFGLLAKQKGFYAVFALFCCSVVTLRTFSRGNVCGDDLSDLSALEQCQSVYLPVILQQSFISYSLALEMTRLKTLHVLV